MLLPYNTDANLYHLPIATISLIVINTLFFSLYPLRTNNGLPAETLLALVEEMHAADAIPSDRYKEYKERLQERIGDSTPEQNPSDDEESTEAKAEITIPAPDPLTLQYGRGIRPWQWVTSRFLHGNVFHLVGSMIWLWTFGLIVEGKVGWQKFLGIYFGIMLVECIIEQTAMLGVFPTPWACSLGPSAIVFGLMAIAMVWIPSHDIHCLVGIWPWSLPAAGVGGFYLMFNVITGFFLFRYESFGAPTYALIDAIGGLLGLVIGVALLKYDLVETDNWDLFSIWAGKHRLSYDEAFQATQQSDSNEAEQIENGLAQIREVLQEGTSPQLAYRAHINMQRKYANWHLPDADFLLTIKQLTQKQDFEVALQAIHEYLRTPRGKQDQVRLKQASILLDEMNRPGEAVNVLLKVDRHQLNDRERAIFSKLYARAKGKGDDDLLGILVD